jgi:hypothetical protein
VVCARRGHPVSSLVNGLGGELRQFALAQLNRTSMTTVAAALVTVSEFTSHEWIGLIQSDDAVWVPRHASSSFAVNRAGSLMHTA